MATIQTNWFKQKYNKHSDEAITITERIFSQNTFSLKVTELYVVLQKNAHQIQHCSRSSRDPVKAQLNTDATSLILCREFLNLKKIAFGL